MIVECYAALARLIGCLDEAGGRSEADLLLRSERSASTSGEAISGIGLILHDLVDRGVADDLNVRSQQPHILTLGEAARERSNRS
jgi:hypothetical protein